jgi:hypothetical protein
MKTTLITLILFRSLCLHAQELYSLTEPASNIAAGSIAIRFDNSIMDEIDSKKANYHFIPAIMVGVSKKFMLQANAFFSNRNDKFAYEGASVYGKYRFLSSDVLQKHFRMAVFARLSFNRSDVHQQEINMYGHNSGFEGGIVATQLLRKVALSSSLSFLKATDNGNNNKFIYDTKESRAVNYTFSVGKLILPREYSSYRQTNVNIMMECLSQVNMGSGKYFVDVAPVIQFIFNSRSKLDMGYKKELTSTMSRTAPNGFFIRLEHNFFNVF